MIFTKIVSVSGSLKSFNVRESTHKLKIHSSGCEQQTEIYSKAQIELKIS